MQDGKLQSIEPVVDKVNNITQKEINMKKSGVTRHKYLLVIAEALEATIERKSDKPNEEGRYDMVIVPDWSRRQWGAEMASKLFGDQIERKEIEHDIGDKTLERFRSLSVAELKEKARKILDATAVTTQSRLPMGEEEL